MKDFFISYNKNDMSWAEWIAWTLEEAGYSVVIQPWDFRPGGNFVLDMHKAMKDCERIIAVISSSYLASAYTEPEWVSAFVRDPTGEKKSVIPIRVESVELKGLLASIIYVDLVGLDEDEARTELLNSISRRAKPVAPPAYPKRKHKTVTKQPLSYPGAELPDPPELAPYIEQFRGEYPDPRKSAFIIMRFGTSPRHNAIVNAIRQALNKHNIQALRADDRAYADYLMQNIRTYMHGCGFGIAVFERIESDIHNPNVALEVGYMLALGKRVCLLKDKTLKALPTDVIGSLYMEFDIDNVDVSVQEALDSWLKQRGII